MPSYRARRQLAIGGRGDGAAPSRGLRGPGGFGIASTAPIVATGARRQQREIAKQQPEKDRALAKPQDHWQGGGDLGGPCGNGEAARLAAPPSARRTRQTQGPSAQRAALRTRRPGRIVAAAARATANRVEVQTVFPAASRRPGPRLGGGRSTAAAAAAIAEPLQGPSASVCFNLPKSISRQAANIIDLAPEGRA